jgi:hypothetical protein
MDKYTTQAKIDALKADPKQAEELAIEEKKEIISNDAYAITDLIDRLIDKIDQARISLR